jgi:PAS domain S-box-containing protein
MEKANISNNLLFNKNHFELLIKLNRISFDNNDHSLEDIYNLNTETLVEGLGIDRASFWRIEQDKLVCINLFDKSDNFHSNAGQLETRDLPIYFKALNDGIAIVADDVMTNQYTQELKENYFIPLGITDLLDLPIRENGKVIGVLCCEHRQDEREWSESDLVFAKSVADTLSLMIEHKKCRSIEMKLIETERKLSLITDNSNDGFVVFENRSPTYVSRSYLDYMGFTEQEALNMSLEDVFNNVHPDDVAEIKAIVDFNLERKNKNFKYAFRFKNRLGEYCWREDTACVLYDDSNQEVYSKYMVVSRDITPMKNAEATIEKLYAISKNQGEKILDFTHIISHNIRSNTSNISMIIDLIGDMVDSSEKEEYFQLLKESNNKLSDTIHYLNETINAQLNKKNQKINLNLKTQIEKTLSGINGIIKNKFVDLEIQVPQNIEIYTIPTYFESIIFNLVTNAVKYKSPDRKLEITIKAQKKNSKTTIEIIDNGLGINMERNKDKIFGMYKTFHGNEDAVGLGLFMTKNHIETLGGEISVKSKVGIGSEFKFTLNDQV